MAYIKRYTITNNKGVVFADTDAWIAAHGPCGTGMGFPSTMTLTEDKTGVVVEITYANQAECDQHEARSNELEGPGSGIDTSWVLNSKG